MNGVKRWSIAAVLVVVLATAAVLYWRSMPPSVPDLPPEQAAALGSRLAAAANARDSQLALSLLDQGANPDQPGEDGTPAIVWAAYYSDTELARQLLRYGANANATSRLGLTALHVAAGNGDIDTVDVLLDGGADYAQRENAGLTPLMMAARKGNPEVIDALLDAGADVDDADPENGVTALMLAGWYGNSDATRLLLDAGADFTAQTTIGPVPEFRPPGFGGGSHGDGIVRGGVPPQGRRAPVPGGMTALFYAIRAGDMESTRMLVDAGADIEHGEANNITPLMMAILNQRLDIATYLIGKGANVNAADWYGRAPLFAAVEVRNLEMPSDSTENGVDRAAAFELIKLLVDKGAELDKRVEEYPPVRDYLMEGGSYAWVDVTGQTAFFRAALSGDVDTMKLLIDHGADPNIETYRGTSPLMSAAGVNWVYFSTWDEGEDQLIKAIELCIEAGQDVNQANSMGVTALDGAANRGANKIVQFLVDKGARLDVADNEGRTPYVWAKGVFLATTPAMEKPETMALIARLCDERGLDCGWKPRKVTAS